MNYNANQSSQAQVAVTPVILCGGSGTRLWPLSRSGFPKQFLVLHGSQSLFQQAFLRLHNLSNERICINQQIVVTNEEHRFLALEQLQELQGGHSLSDQIEFILEPLGKNTAPALTLAALEATKNGGDPVLVVTPADQTIQNIEGFCKQLQQAIEAATENQIVILGIPPSHPETGYGYIQINPSDLVVQPVKQFTEKPDLQTAQSYLREGHYFWNSGIFILKASLWLQAIKKQRNDIWQATEAAWQNATIDRLGDAGQIQFVRPDRSLFEAIPAESIDYAVIEHCPGSDIPIVMLELDVGWNDLGSWDAVWQTGMQNQEGNVAMGDVLSSESTNTLAIANHRLVSTVGVDNLVIIETADAVLVADRKRSQEVKAIVSQLEKQGREEKNLHRKVNRPWGWYDSIDEGERFKVKRIQVKPGASLSLQMHHHRAEHWIVVKGVAEITNGEQLFTLTENQSTYIPQGQKHRLRNPGSTPLEIIEVQSGSYLGEDDIVRFEDQFGRC